MRRETLSAFMDELEKIALKKSTVDSAAKQMGLVHGGELRQLHADAATVRDRVWRKYWHGTREEAVTRARTGDRTAKTYLSNRMKRDVSRMLRQAGKRVR
jgi:hypothetical protein